MNGDVVDTIYLDFAKAFDTVPHRRLIGKSYGVSANILNWINAFLNGGSAVSLCIKWASARHCSGGQYCLLSTPTIYLKPLHRIHLYLLTTQKYSAILHNCKIPKHYNQ